MTKTMNQTYRLTKYNVSMFVSLTHVFQITIMAETQANVETPQKLTWKSTFPEEYNKVNGKNNVRVDFN